MKNNELSAGRKSLNDSQLDMSGGPASVSGFTGGDQTLQMYQSLTANQLSHSTKVVKAKPRDFKANPKLLADIGADNYDIIPDLNELQINMENKVEKLREQWKCYDTEKLKMMIRKQVIMELTAIECRKNVRIVRAEDIAKRKAQLEEEGEE